MEEDEIIIFELSCKKKVVGFWIHLVPFKENMKK
jgi:hypothetical protein